VARPAFEALTGRPAATVDAVDAFAPPPAD